MKIVVLKPRGEKLVRILIDTNEEPDYREKYLPENGMCWDCFDEEATEPQDEKSENPIIPEEVVTPTADVSKKEITPKPKKPITPKK